LEAVREASSHAAAETGNKKPVNWIKAVAGFTFLLGLLVSASRFWGFEPGNPGFAGMAREVAPVATQAKYQAAPVSGEVAEFSSIEADNLQPAASSADKGRGISPLGRTAKNQPQPDNWWTRTQQRGRAQGAHSRSWLMADDGSPADRIQACEQRGIATRDCEFLETNLMAERVIQLPGGVQYTVLQNGSGASPGINDTVLVNYKGMLLDGQLFDSSLHRSFRIHDLIAGLQDVLQYMEEGARWEVYIPGDLAYKEPARYGGQTLVFEIELLSVEKPGTQGKQSGWPAWQDEHQPPAAVEQENVAADNMSDILPRWQQSEIDAQQFLEDNARREGVFTLPSGFQYKILKAGDGSGLSPRTSDTVRIHIRGTTPDGNELDNSYQDGEPLTLVLEEAIPGWQEALLQMESGEKREIYIPPALQENSEIAKLGTRGRQPQIYEIELISINPSNSAD
jgi:FKBP-type peptidyl-prolyl cis-trans isomerase